MKEKIATSIRAKPDACLLALVFLASFVPHVMTAATTVTFSDSGDFLMAISSVGNCHGPGYPTFLMLSRLFSWIFPFGSLAFRVSVLSGIFASLTACLIYWAIWRMTRSRLGGVVAGIAYAFSFTFWYQSTIPETYALNGFFIALLVVLSLRWERQIKAGMRGRADNTLAAFAFVFALALTNHYSAVFLLPAFAFFALDTDWRAVLGARNLFRVAAFFALGLLPYVYEPAAAFRGPVYNYGDPSTLARWIHHVTLYYQRGGLFEYPTPFFVMRFWRYFGTLTTEFPYVFWLAGLGVLASFVRRSKKYALFLALMFLVTALAVMTYDNLESVIRAHFYYPSYLIVSLWIGFGAAWLSNLARRWGRHKDSLVNAAAVGLVAVALVALAFVALPVHYSKVDKSGYTYARDMAVKMLTRAGPDGLILTDADNVVFPLKYMQYIEGVNPDVRVINPRSLGVPGWPGADLDRTIPPPEVVVSEGDPTYMRLAKKNYTRVPVYNTEMAFNFAGTDEQWQGLMTRIYPPGAPRAAAKPILLDRGDEPLADIDSDAREALALPDVLRGTMASNRGDAERAQEHYGAATEIGTRDLYVPVLYGVDTISNVFDVRATALNSLGRYEKTVEVTPEVFEINPDFVALSYAYALSRTGRSSEALGELYDYLIAYPGSSAAYIQRGEIQLMEGMVSQALESFSSAVEVDPQSPRAHYDLGLALYQSGDRKGAVEEMSIAIEKGAGDEWAQNAREFLDSLEEKKPPPATL